MKLLQFMNNDNEIGQMESEDFFWLMKTEVSADFQRSVTRFILKVGN